MATSPSSAVLDARRALGRRLREIRRPTGLTARAFAARAGWSESKASRIENGKTSPSDPDLLTYATLCGVPELYVDLVSTLHNIEEMYVEWRRLQSDGLRQIQQAHVPLYERTRHFRVYEPGVIPGLLQTGDYAQAIMKRIVSFWDIPDDTEAAAKVRVDRQRVLREGDRRFAFLVEETALWSRFGTADVMAAQLGHLLTVGSLPQVSLGVIPMTAERTMWPLEGFWIFDKDQVIIELATAQVTVKQPSEVGTYLQMFAKLADIACYGQQARNLIAKAISSLG
ncbi:helix-turn-helix domain-containing protein [Streptomyces sp. SID13666]|uniref:Scr1 family TA system antitoxin-like transcriptional regulator n=1 Tax=Streptomyces sp. SID13666 TaxID=2706054 RepID=UPI0013BF9B23|nr:helix-turn-helix domain-containing protein [Streptomyces sp. SID13666]NEA72247.1 helix-turn-helix domain-containing protein [Streptomyces sp. SID13588]